MWRGQLYYSRHNYVRVMQRFLFGKIMDVIDQLQNLGVDINPRELRGELDKAQELPQPTSEPGPEELASE